MTLFSKVFHDLGPRLLICADQSGHIIEHLPANPPFNAHTLAALAAANLAAAREMKLLSDIQMGDNDVDLLITSTERGAILAVQRRDELIFVAVTGPNTRIGIAKLLLVRLARTYTREEAVQEDQRAKQTLFHRLMRGKGLDMDYNNR